MADVVITISGDASGALAAFGQADAAAGRFQETLVSVSGMGGEQPFVVLGQGAEYAAAGVRGAGKAGEEAAGGLGFGRAEVTRLIFALGSLSGTSRMAATSLGQLVMGGLGPAALAIVATTLVVRAFGAAMEANAAEEAAEKRRLEETAKAYYEAAAAARELLRARGQLYPGAEFFATQEQLKMAATGGVTVEQAAEMQRAVPSATTEDLVEMAEAFQDPELGEKVRKDPGRYARWFQKRPGEEQRARAGRGRIAIGNLPSAIQGAAQAAGAADRQAALTVEDLAVRDYAAWRGVGIEEAESELSFAAGTESGWQDLRGLFGEPIPMRRRRLRGVLRDWAAQSKGRPELGQPPYGPPEALEMKRYVGMEIHNHFAGPGAAKGQLNGQPRVKD